MPDTLQIQGYREFLRAVQRADKDTKREVRAAFQKVGDVVRTEAQSRVVRLDEKSARGLKTRVRQRGIEVDQALKVSSVPGRRRRNWSDRVMSLAMLPALDSKRNEAEREMNNAIRRVADHFERRSL